MSQEQWSAVDRFIADMIVPTDPPGAALADSAAAHLGAGLPHYRCRDSLQDL